MQARTNTNKNIGAFLSEAAQRYDFRAEADSAVINIFGEIDDWWGFGVREMAYNLSNVKGQKLTLNIHSPGGSVTEGIGIANLIKSHDAHTTTKGVGFVASIASIVLLAGDTVQLAENAFLMIHNPWTLAAGDSEEMRHTADLLDKMENNLADVYTAAMNARGNKITKAEVMALMAAETWYTADEAKAAGLIDEVAGRVEIADSKESAALQNEMLAKYNNIPQALAESLNTFSNTNKKNMADKNNNIFAKLGQLFVAAAADEETPPVTIPDKDDDEKDATMTVEEAIELLKKDGYTVAKEEEKKKEPEEEEEEVSELVALRKEMAELKAAFKRKAGAPSGGAEGDANTDKDSVPKKVAPFFDALANAIKSHRPG